MNRGNERIYFLENLKIFLIFLVVLHHWAIANGGPGDWYYTPERFQNGRSLLLSVFIAVNQAFFMGLFFLISGFVTNRSLTKGKSFIYFVTTRFHRLIIPLLLYILILSPLIQLIISSNWSLSNLIQTIFKSIQDPAPGPLWFVLILFIFNVFHHLMRKNFSSPSSYKIKAKFFILFVPIIVILIFIIRIFFPVGYWTSYLVFQPAHIIQYIVCYFIGAYLQGNDGISFKVFRNYKGSLIITLVLIIVVLPAIFIINGVNEPYEQLMGGLNYQAFLYALWEQILCITISIGLLGFFMSFLNKQYKAMSFVSKTLFSIYFSHSLSIVIFSLYVEQYKLPCLLQFFIGIPPMLLVTLFVAIFVRKLPIFRRVL